MQTRIVRRVVLHNPSCRRRAPPRLSKRPRHGSRSHTNGRLVLHALFFRFFLFCAGLSRSRSHATLLVWQCLSVCAAAMTKPPRRVRVGLGRQEKKKSGSASPTGISLDFFFFPPPTPRRPAPETTRPMFFLVSYFLTILFFIQYQRQSQLRGARHAIQPHILRGHLFFVALASCRVPSLFFFSWPARSAGPIRACVAVCAKRGEKTKQKGTAGNLRPREDKYAKAREAQETSDRHGRPWRHGRRGDYHRRQ